MPRHGVLQIATVTGNKQRFIGLDMHVSLKSSIEPMPDTIEARSITPEVEFVAAAKQAGLRYVTDRSAGIYRRRAGKSFSYRDGDDRKITDPVALARIQKLAIPPAWNNVWICKTANGHLQATGIDAKGRKQYRYHATWRAVRDETKYNRMVAFGRALPAIRARVARDLKREGLPREKILATIVRLLETTLIRIGNREYARDNASFGLTTLRNRHVAVQGDTVHFEFKAKSGKMRRLDLKDRTMARLVKRCRDLPGYELFQYVDRDGRRHSVTSDDVNDYLRETTGADFTAKDFRTWAGTVLAALALQELQAFDSQAAAKRNITNAIEHVAGKLGNTVSICRKCYVHPEIFDAYLDGSLAIGLKEDIETKLKDELADLSPEEGVVLAFLQRRLAGGESLAKDAR
jgi:DNA topoisomerase-1